MPFTQIIPRPFGAVAIRTYAPSVSGVYGISNSQQWIYIGETDDIKGALLAHLKEHDTSVSQKGPTGFVYEVCDPGRRAGRQDRLVSEYEPACNRHAPRI
jgi:hypothetical protein